MAREDDYHDWVPRNLENQRTIEDQQRDDIIALTYLNSKQFGSGIDVTGSPRTLPEQTKVPEVKPGVPFENASPEMVTEQIVSIEDPGEIDLSQQQTTSFSLTSPPPQDLAPDTTEFGAEGMLERVAGDIPESVVPPPLAPSFSQLVSLGEPEIEIPSDTQVVSMPQPAVALEPMPEPPPLDPTVIPLPESVEVAEVPDAVEPDPMPWLPTPDFKVDRPFDKDQLQDAIEESGENQLATDGLNELARAQSQYLDQVAEIFYAMADRLDEAMARLRELEAASDRRYRRTLG